MSKEPEKQPTDDQLWNKTFDDAPEVDPTAGLDETTVKETAPEANQETDSEAEAPVEEVSLDDDPKALRSKRVGNQLLTLLVILVVGLAATPVIYWVQNQNKFSHPQTEAVESSNKQHSEEASKRASQKAASEKKASETAAKKKAAAKKSSELAKKKAAKAKQASEKKQAAKEASKAKRASQKAAKAAKASSKAAAKAAKEASQTSASQANDNQAQAPQQSATQTNNAGSNYATVQAGQGLYRVAVNNGITVQQLMQMNGLSSSSNLQPGQQLRVR